MKIGKLTFDEIIKNCFDGQKLWLAFKGIFLALLLSFFATATMNLLPGIFAGNSSTMNKVDFVVSLLSSLIVIASALGVLALIKADLTKGKKVKNILAEIKLNFGRTILAVISFLLLVALILAAAVVVGYLGKIPGVGPYLMALLCLPAVAFLAFVAVFIVGTSNLLFPAILENPKANTLAIIKNLIAITRQNPKKIIYFKALSCLPVLIILLALGITFVLAYLIYLVGLWLIPGLSNIFQLSLVASTNLLSYIVNISSLAIAGYILAHLLVLELTIAYSIYLDVNQD